MTHYSWDQGVLDFLPGKPKTTKTLCEKRVPIDQIDNEAPDCPACIATEKDIMNAAHIVWDNYHPKDPGTHPQIISKIRKHFTGKR